MRTAKDKLHGIQLKDGWKVVESLTKNQTDTGGYFSAGYIVQSPGGIRHFLKAIDFSAAQKSADPARALQQLTEAFNLERDILEISKRLSCVVTSIADGTVIVNDGGASEVVQYLILELAEDNLRRMAVQSRRLPMPIALRALHNVANGMWQLHRRQIAHQDVKPSNVLKFEGEQFKICDVGRASMKGRIAPHDHLNVAGDMSYAPPELLYGQVDPQFNTRRLACDAYLLGSLATFLVTGVPLTHLLVQELDPTARPAVWRGTYGAVLPQVRAAYSRVCVRISGNIASEAPYRAELLLCIEQLCDPDPALRGHPATRAEQARSGNVYDLERYVSIFDRLALVARIFETRAR